jgi:hypothetical protein
VFVLDGQAIDVSLNLKSSCYVAASSGPVCIMPLFYRLKNKNKIFINRNLLTKLKAKKNTKK